MCVCLGLPDVEKKWDDRVDTIQIHKGWGGGGGGGVRGSQNIDFHL